MSFYDSVWPLIAWSALCVVGIVCVSADRVRAGVAAFIPAAMLAAGLLATGLMDPDRAAGALGAALGAIAILLTLLAAFAGMLLNLLLKKVKRSWSK